METYLEELAPPERLDLICNGAPLSDDERQIVVTRWVGQQFEDPDQGWVTAYQVHDLFADGVVQCALVTYWTDAYLDEGRLEAAFRTTSSAREWLRQQGILDEEWKEDASAAGLRAFRALDSRLAMEGALDTRGGCS